MMKRVLRTFSCPDLCPDLTNIAGGGIIPAEGRVEGSIGSELRFSTLSVFLLEGSAYLSR